MPVAKELSPDDVRIEPHYLQILDVVPFGERHGAAFVVVHPRRCVADYVYLTVTEQNRNDHRTSIFRRISIVRLVLLYLSYLTLYSRKLNIPSDTIRCFRSR